MFKILRHRAALTIFLRSGLALAASLPTAAQAATSSTEAPYFCALHDQAEVRRAVCSDPELWPLHASMESAAAEAVQQLVPLAGSSAAVAEFRESQKRFESAMIARCEPAAANCVRAQIQARLDELPGVVAALRGRLEAAARDQATAEAARKVAEQAEKDKNARAAAELAAAKAAAEAAARAKADAQARALLQLQIGGAALVALTLLGAAWAWRRHSRQSPRAERNAQGPGARVGWAAAAAAGLASVFGGVMLLGGLASGGADLNKASAPQRDHAVAAAPAPKPPPAPARREVLKPEELLWSRSGGFGPQYIYCTRVGNPDLAREHTEKVHPLISWKRDAEFRLSFDRRLLSIEMNERIEHPSMMKGKHITFSGFGASYTFSGYSNDPKNPEDQGNILNGINYEVRKDTANTASLLENQRIDNSTGNFKFTTLSFPPPKITYVGPPVYESLDISQTVVHLFTIDAIGMEDGAHGIQKELKLKCAGHFMRPELIAKIQANRRQNSTDRANDPNAQLVDRIEAKGGTCSIIAGRLESLRVQATKNGDWSDFQALLGKSLQYNC